MTDVCWCPYCDKANFIDCDDLKDTEQYDYNCQRCKKKFNFRFLWKADIETTPFHGSQNLNKAKVKE